MTTEPRKPRTLTRRRRRIPLLLLVSAAILVTGVPAGYAFGQSARQQQLRQQADARRADLERRAAERRNNLRRLANSSSGRAARPGRVPQPGETLYIEGTLEAAPGYPWVHVQLSQNRRVLSADPNLPRNNPLGGLSTLSAIDSLNDLSASDYSSDDYNRPRTDESLSFTAVLDTGASGHVISGYTQARFGIEPAAGAVYHETGLHRETPMGVSEAYTLALAGSMGQPDDPPVSGFFTIHRNDARMLLNPSQPHAETIKPAMGAVNLIGMPAIMNLVVELDPAPMIRDERDSRSAAVNNSGRLTPNQQLDALIDGVGDAFATMSQGPIVRLHPADRYAARGHLEIPLVMRDFNRHKNPKDRPPSPSLAMNPMIPGVVTVVGSSTYKADFILDTGAPASIISTEHARSLGLVDEAGNPLRTPDFELQFGGIGGELTKRPGFVIDSLSIKTTSGVTITYTKPHVVVHDASIVNDEGETVTIHGLLGTNLLLPSVGGLGTTQMGLPTSHSPPPFRKVFIDPSRGRMLLELFL